MTTIQLIERGVGHNCLSDAYELGRADAFNLIKENWEQLKSAYRMNGHNLDTDMWLDDFLTEQLKEKTNE